MMPTAATNRHSFRRQLLNGALLLGVLATTSGCAISQRLFAGGGTAKTSGQQAPKSPSLLASSVGKALEAGDTAAAVTLASLATQSDAASPDATLLLARALMADGQFTRANAVLAPLAAGKEEPRARLSRALAAIGGGDAANGRRLLLEGLKSMPSEEPALTADIGLALAISGDITSGRALLEAAARQADAEPRTRQNLALIYAMDGDWQRAKATAAVDLPAEQVAATLQQWSLLLSQPAPQRIAVLMGAKAERLPAVLPDVGAPAAPPEAVAEAAKVSPAAGGDTPAKPRAIYVAPAAAVADAHLALGLTGDETEASLDPPAPRAKARPADWKAVDVVPMSEQRKAFSTTEAALIEPQAGGRYQPLAPAAKMKPAKAAAKTVDAPATTAVKPAKVQAPALIGAAKTASKLAQAKSAPQKAPPVATVAAAKPAVARAADTWVVQLGAFNNDASAVKGWGQLRGVHATLKAKGRPLMARDAKSVVAQTRLVVGGLGGKMAAWRYCKALKAEGGSCFIRPLDAGFTTRSV